MCYAQGFFGSILSNAALHRDGGQITTSSIRVHHALGAMASRMTIAHIIITCPHPRGVSAFPVDTGLPDRCPTDHLSPERNV